MLLFQNPNTIHSIEVRGKAVIQRTLAYPEYEKSQINLQNEQLPIIRGSKTFRNPKLYNQ
jgi:hypothetical protein